MPRLSSRFRAGTSLASPPPWQNRAVCHCLELSTYEIQNTKDVECGKPWRGADCWEQKPWLRQQSDPLAFSQPPCSTFDIRLSTFRVMLCHRVPADGVDAGGPTAMGIVPKAISSPMGEFRAEGGGPVPSGGRDLPVDAGGPTAMGISPKAECSCIGLFCAGGISPVPSGGRDLPRPGPTSRVLLHSSCRACPASKTRPSPARSRRSGSAPRNGGRRHTP